VPPIALIAPLARVPRSTPNKGDHRMPATERYHRLPISAYPPPGGIWPPEESQTSLTAEPLDLRYKHEIVRRVHQERDQARAVRPEMQ
jgi:hypothetical protein